MSADQDQPNALAKVRATRMMLGMLLKDEQHLRATVREIEEAARTDPHALAAVLRVLSGELADVVVEQLGSEELAIETLRIAVLDATLDT